jgi:hypothetical protein
MLYSLCSWGEDYVVKPLLPFFFCSSRSRDPLEMAQKRILRS